MTDLIPPLPPGVEKKQGFFKKMFSKKETPKQQEGLPTAPTPAKNTDSEIDGLPKPAAKASMPELAPIPAISKDMELNTIRKTLGLDESNAPTSSPAPKPQETTQPTQKMGRIDDFALDVPPRAMPQTTAIPPIQKQNGGIKDLLQDIKPNYQPSKDLPPIPKFNTSPQDYKTIDFTKELSSDLPSMKDDDSDLSWDDADLFSTPAKKAITSRQIDSLEKMRASGAGIDWTSDDHHQKPALANDKGKQDLIKELEDKIMHDDAEEPEKTVPAHELPAIKPQPKKTTKKAAENESAKELPATKSKETEKTNKASNVNVHDEKFLSQPVQKFADQIRQKIADQVRQEEKHKLLEELKKEKDEEIKRIELESSKKLEAEKQKFIAQLKQEQEQEINKKELAYKKTMDGEKETILNQARQELENAKKERLAAQKELNAKQTKLDNDQAALEKKQQELDQRERSISEKEAALNKTKSDFKAEKSKLESDKQEAQELLNKLSKMKEEFKNLQSKIDMINQRIKLNEQLENNLAKREAAIEEAQIKFRDLEKNIRERGFSQYLDTELNAKQISYPETKSKISDIKQEEDHSDIYQIIDKCRSMVWQNNIKEARNAYMEARDRYHNLVEKGEQDEKLYMAIRELYDDINLAVMK